MSEWIKTSERLPELDKLVLLLDVNGHTCIGARVDSGEGWLWAEALTVRFSDGKFETWDLEEDDMATVYWCDFFSTVPPLPPLPEEVTNG